MSINRISNYNIKYSDPSANVILDIIKYYELSQFDVAESKALSITKKFPKHQFCWKVLAAIFIKKNKNHEALEANKMALKLNPQDVEVLNNLGIILKNLGKLKESEKNLKKAISLKPNFAEAYFNLGITLNALGRLEEAEKNYITAVKFKPNYVQAYNNLGNLQKEIGELNKAEKSFRKAIEVSTGFTAAHRNLAMTLRDLGKTEEATESEKYIKLLNSSNIKIDKSRKFSEIFPFRHPSPMEYPLLYRAGMGTENVGGFLRAMAQMLRPKNILEIGAGYTTPFLLEAIINNHRVYDDGNLEPSYFNNYTYEPKLVVIDNMSLGELRNKPGMNEIISSKYTEFFEGSFEGKADMLSKKYDVFDFVWFDCGGADEYQKFMNEYWNVCSNYIFFHYTYSSGRPNELYDIILKNMTGNLSIFDIVEPHKSRQGSITMVKKK